MKIIIRCKIHQLLFYIIVMMTMCCISKHSEYRSLLPGWFYGLNIVTLDILHHELSRNSLKIIWRTGGRQKQEGGLHRFCDPSNYSRMYERYETWTMKWPRYRSSRFFGSQLKQLNIRLPVVCMHTTDTRRFFTLLIY